MKIRIVCSKPERNNVINILKIYLTIEEFNELNIVERMTSYEIIHFTYKLSYEMLAKLIPVSYFYITDDIVCNNNKGQINVATGNSQINTSQNVYRKE